MLYVHALDAVHAVDAVDAVDVDDDTYRANLRGGVCAWCLGGDARHA